MKKCWITWEYQIRNVNMANELNATYIEHNFFKFPKVLRYILAISYTICSLIKHRPDLLFVSNPSIILSVLSILLRPIFRYQVCIDTHNGGFGIYHIGIHKKVCDWIQRNADIIIAHNKLLADQVSYVNPTNIIVVHDPVPDNHSKFVSPKTKPEEFINPETKKSYFNVLYVCSWANDEPYRIVLETIKAFNNNVSEIARSDIKIHLTGDYKKQDDMLPLYYAFDNTEFHGRVSNEKLYNMMSYCDVIIGLTTRENCNLCVAHEAVSYGKWLITSNTDSLKDRFSKLGVNYINNANQLFQLLNNATNARTVANSIHMRHKQHDFIDLTHTEINNLLSKF